MKPSVIRDLTDVELENRLKNVSRIKEVKKDIARVLTIMHLRQLGSK